MKKFNSKVYVSFTNFLSTLEVKAPSNRWSSVGFEGIEKVIDCWNKMSYADKKRLVSDTRWNHYPLVSYTPRSTKRFGRVVSAIVSSVINGDNNRDKDILSKNSQGVFAVYMLDNSPSAIRLKMSKRLQQSKDVRVRTRCAKILPVHLLKPMLKDKAYSVRNAAITRVGMDNCYQSFLPTDLRDTNSSGDTNIWYQRWLQRQAVSLSTADELKSLASSLRGLEYSEISGSYAADMLISELIKKSSKEEVLYLLGLFGHSRHIDSALSEKIGSTT